MPNPPIPEFNYQVNKDSTGQFREHMARLTHWGNQGWSRVAELEAENARFRAALNRIGPKCESQPERIAREALN